jgi:hypothetical protein
MWTHHLVTYWYLLGRAVWLELDGVFWITTPHPSAITGPHALSPRQIRVGDRVSIQRGEPAAEVIVDTMAHLRTPRFHPYHCHHLLCGEARVW